MLCHYFLHIHDSYLLSLVIMYLFFPGVKADLTKIGFIGLGNMGGPMARNVLDKVITA